MHTNDAVSISSAADRLAALGDRVERTALSRYVKSHGLPTVKAGRETLVSFSALVNHRRTNELLGAAAHNLPRMNASDEPVGPAAASVPALAVTASKSDGQSRKWAADADLRELELARETGRLVERSVVENAAGDAIAAMETAMLGTLNTTAEALAEEFRVEPRRVRQRLRTMVEDGLARFRKEMEALQPTE